MVQFQGKKVEVKWQVKKLLQLPVWKNRAWQFSGLCDCRARDIFTWHLTTKIGKFGFLRKWDAGASNWDCHTRNEVTLEGEIWSPLTYVECDIPVNHDRTQVKVSGKRSPRSGKLKIHQPPLTSLSLTPKIAMSSHRKWLYNFHSLI